MTASTTLNRRDFFRGAVASPRSAEILPPWVALSGLAKCTTCGDCVDACPENVLKIDEAAAYPTIDFQETGCTFCGDCAKACAQGVFDETHQVAWQSEVLVSSECLVNKGVACQLCTDFCDFDALRFDVSARPVGALVVAQRNCTGCGMCIGACPTNALSLVANANGGTT